MKGAAPSQDATPPTDPAPTKNVPAATPSEGPAGSGVQAGSETKGGSGDRRDPETRRDRRASPPPTVGKIPRVRPGSRTENLIAAFLFAILVGCAGIWLEHNRCPGALRMAATAAAPLAVAAAVPIAGLLAMVDRHADRDRKIRRGILFAFWAGAASLSIATAWLMSANERGEVETFNRTCVVARREPVPAPDAGVRDWILVLRCADQMSLVRVDVDRKKWWAHEPGAPVEAQLARGSLGFEWVLDVPALGPPIRHLP